MTAAGALGLCAGLAVAGLDRVALTPPPVELGTVDSARMMLTGFLGGLITVAVFSLWMRTVVVGLVSDQFSPRVLVAFLDDGFQRKLLGAIAVGLVAVAVILLSLPEAEDAPIPIASTIFAVLVALAALGAVFAAIQHAIASLSPLELVSRLAERALEVLEGKPRTDEDVRPPAPRADARSIWGQQAGWVSHIDTDALLAALPAGGALHLNVRIGEFITPHTRVALLSSAAEEENIDFEALRGAIRLSRTRDPERDLAFAIGHLTDVAVHALAGGSNDTATAHEALVHLGAVLERVIEHGVAPDHRCGDEGRRVYDEAAWTPANYLEMVAKRLRSLAAGEPDTALHLLDALAKARAAAVSAGDSFSQSEAERQVDAVVAHVQRRGELDGGDRRRLEHAAELIARGELLR